MVLDNDAALSEPRVVSVQCKDYRELAKKEGNEIEEDDEEDEEGEETE